MSPDLEAILRGTAERPSQQADVSAMICRGRRRRYRRRAAQVLGAAASVVLVTILLGVLDQAEQEVQFADPPSVAPADPKATEESPEREKEPESFDRSDLPPPDPPDGEPAPLSWHDPDGSPDPDGPPSQSEEAALRDGVVPELAALPLPMRSRYAGFEEPFAVRTDEGLWTISRPHDDVYPLTDGCGLGNPEGLYGRDIVCVIEYGEVILVDEDTQTVMRAYPLPGVPPQWFTVTDDAVYCGRQGDGALSTSMLCRIDRETHDVAVRLFPDPDETREAVLAYMAEYVEVAGWLVVAPPAPIMYGLYVREGTVSVITDDGLVGMDPQTLELSD